ncbi:TATA box-binding protein-associated factor RNA polymerase I subunit C isoform X2 [Panthera leo]|uniref:TATA box-binding protein-associated factor RNA polymerase I subunit C isoform X2 n=1 Tax=Panthera leo TaxID=9689 RepID=UPI001C696F24|nr:TATA box-binding protein-associated factor RNA polymerase I subunit C isoform X2 [Panthera leo]
MDFPGSLPPTLFRTGPLGVSNTPDLSFMCSWRDALTLPEPLAQNSQNGVSCTAAAPLWEPETPGPLPLLPPGPDPWDPGVTARDLLFRGGIPFRRKPRAVLDVTEQLSRFLWDHGDIAFAPLGKLMLENFKLEGARSHSKKKTVVSVKSLLQDLGGHQPWGCPWASLSFRQRRFSILGGPVLGTSVAGLLGELLHEELATRWERLLLDDAFTGGALAWVPGRTPQVGQLVYPAGGALDKLHFQEVSVAPGGDPQALGDPGHIQLRGPVRQVVTHTVQGEALLAVRSDYHCALWKVSKQGCPAPLRVLQIGKGATGISLSPHLPGELAVCSRSGAVCLWTPQDGLQQIYKDPETLVFRDPSPWRWADFTAHPRVLTVGDRTGVKIIDTQGPPGCGLLLFRGGAEAACQKGERVLLTRYLGGCGPEPLCPTFHLILTQFSLYLVDERLPLVPLLKWNHDLPSAPLFAQLLPPPQPGHAQPLLLGGQGGHLRLLQLAVSPLRQRLPLRVPPAGAQESVAAAGASESANPRSGCRPPALCLRAGPGPLPAFRGWGCLPPAPPPPGGPRARLRRPRGFLDSPGHRPLRPVAEGPAGGTPASPRVGSTHLLPPPCARLRGTAADGTEGAGGSPRGHGRRATPTAEGPGRRPLCGATPCPRARPRGRAQCAFGGSLGRPGGRLVGEPAGRELGAREPAQAAQAPDSAVQHLLLAQWPPGPLGRHQPPPQPRPDVP